ncbi:MAG: HlyC/CorC family transporter, partial [Chloroflexi bacterium]|nr:HlyC/CorC family transporter [Chloroflexota bacterium]
MGTSLATLVVVTLLIALSALYVGAEFATVGARRARIKQLAETGDRLARALLPVVEDPRLLDRYIAACQLGITASSLALGAYGQGTVARTLAPALERLGPGMAAPAALSLSTTGVLLLSTALHVLLGELLPKSLALQYRERIALAAVVPVKWSMAVLRPFVWLFNGSGVLLLRLLKMQPATGAAAAHSPDEIELLVAETHRGGLIDAGSRQLLRNAFRFRDLTARQVMTPRVRVVAAPVSSTVAELIALSASSGLSRLPIYRRNIENIVGFVHVKDLFRLSASGGDRQRVVEILRDVSHVPESLPVADIWAALRRKRETMAIVFDEYGGTAGLITLEDLMEEIFGELQDEFDPEVWPASTDRAGRLHLRGDLLVADVNEFLNLKLPEDQADTLGGLLMTALGRIPRVGDEAVFPGAAEPRAEAAPGPDRGPGRAAGPAPGEPEPAPRPGVIIRVEAMAALGVAEVSLRFPHGGPAPDSGNRGP